MSFKISQKGLPQIMLALQRIQTTAPKIMQVVGKEANSRHARAYRRRSIPEDTGRLQRSLRETNNADRRVEVTRQGISIGTDVPYAKYQRRKIRPLTSQEMHYIFVQPILLLLAEVLAGGRE